MVEQSEIVNAMLNRIKPDGTHQIDTGLADILRGIATKHQAHLDQKYPELM